MGAKGEKQMHQILSMSIEEIQAKLAVAKASMDPADKLKTSGPNGKTTSMLAWLKDAKDLVVRPSEFKSVSLLSGISCPGANICKSQAVVDPETGKRSIQDSPGCQFRCFAANDEAMYNETYAQRKHNRDLVLKYKDDPFKLAALILGSLGPKVKLVRFHIGGDFLCMSYLLGVLIAARVRTSMRIYFYTKSLHFLAKLDCDASDLPSNVSPVMSEGGLFDPMLPALKARGFRSVRVFMDPQSAADAGMELDHKDNLAAYGSESFGLLVHGTQPKGSKAGKAVSAMRKAGVKNGYSNNTQRQKAAKMQPAQPR
jgi:hypothetical protein